MTEANAPHAVARALSPGAPARVAEPTELALRAWPLEPMGAGAEMAAPRRAAPRRRIGLFLAAFVLPVAAAGTYLFAVASDRYASQASFIVRSTSGAQAAAGIESLIQSKGTTRASDETFAIVEYLKSRDAIALLRARDGLDQALAREGADPINRYPNFYSRENGESLYWRYQQMVDAKIDEATGIATVEVQAFAPEDAAAIAKALLGYAEAMVNRLNARAYRDALETANGFVDLAMRGVLESERRLADYRGATGMVDPGSETASIFSTIGKLSDQLAQAEAQVAQAQALAPTSPVIASLREQAKSYREEIESQRRRLSGTPTSIASRLPEFEQLVLQRELAAKELESASLSRDSAREDAQRQHLYVQTVAEPNLPDAAKYPRRALYFFAVAGICLVAFSALRGLGALAREHRP